MNRLRGYYLCRLKIRKLEEKKLRKRWDERRFNQLLPVQRIVQEIAKAV